MENKEKAEKILQGLFKELNEKCIDLLPDMFFEEFCKIAKNENWTLKRRKQEFSNFVVDIIVMPLFENVRANKY